MKPVNKFKRLRQKQQGMTASRKIKQEKAKLAFLKGFERHLKTIDIGKKKTLKKKNKQKPFLALQTVFYYFLLGFGLIENAISTYLVAENLLILIPALSNPWVIAGSLLITFINSALFYAVEASMFKEILGIEASQNERTQLIQTYLEKLNTVEQINKILFDFNFILNTPQSDYQRYAELALLMNQDMEKLQNTIGKHHESLAKKAVRYFVRGFGAVICAAGTYFLSTSLVTLFATPLMGTPIGWILIALVLITGLIFYFTMQAPAMMQLLHPEYLPFKDLKLKLKNFEYKNEADFQLVDNLQDHLSQSREGETKNLEPDYDHTSPGFFKSIYRKSRRGLLKLIDLAYLHNLKV